MVIVQAVPPLAVKVFAEFPGVVHLSNAPWVQGTD